jgi:hypothetical protein
VSMSFWRLGKSHLAVRGSHAQRLSIVEIHVP